MKKTLNDLAVFGGSPMFLEMLHVGRPNLGNRERLLERISRILDQRWFTNHGAYVQELEQKIAETINVKHCIAVCNGTVGLEIAIRAVELQGEVIVPSFTFIATAHCLTWQGVTPVFCDIDPRTHNIDPHCAEQLITSRTSGIIGVHLWGRPCDVESLEKVASKYKLKLLFDAAHALSCSYKGEMIGSFGNAEVFSFHATKFFNTFEGGAVVTNNDDLAAKIRLMKNFGFQGHDNVVSIGTNGKMSEVSAAMGLTELESLDDYIDINYHNFKQYQKELADIPGVSVISYDDGERCNYQWVVVEMDEKELRISRDNLIKILHAENILARRYFYPGCHQMEPYRSNYPNNREHLPNTEVLSKRVISLPTGTAVGEKEITQICHILRLALDNSSEVSERLTCNGQKN